MNLRRARVRRQIARMQFVRRRMSWLFIAALALGFGAGRVCADFSPTNRPFPGVSIYSVTRTNPPTRMFVATLNLKQPNLRLRVAPGGPDPDGPGQWQTTLMRPTYIAEREGMALVVNGDFFQARRIIDAEGTNAAYRANIWSSVSGPAVSAGKVWSTSSRERPCLVVDQNNHVSIRLLARPDAGLREVVAGNTLLVRAGVPVTQTNRLRHPRTVVGLDRKQEHLIILVVDGRKPRVAVGMNYDELAQEMLRLGCHDALNLDGGGSSVLAVRESGAKDYRILNQPTDGRERPVANVLGIVIDPGSR